MELSIHTVQETIFDFLFGKITLEARCSVRVVVSALEKLRAHKVIGLAVKGHTIYSSQLSAVNPNLAPFS